MTVLREQVVEAMRAVPDPCSIAMRTPMDVVEMGLIGEVRIEGGHVTVELVLTDPSCVHFRSMSTYIRDVLTGLDGIESVDVVQTTSTLWTPDRVQRRRAAA